MVGRCLLVLFLLFLPYRAWGADLKAFVDHDRIGRDHTILLSVRLLGSDADFPLDTTLLEKNFYVIAKASTHQSGAWFEKHFQLGPRHTGRLKVPVLHTLFHGKMLVTRSFSVHMLAERGEVDDTRLWIETHADRHSAWRRQQINYRIVIFSTSPFLGVPRIELPDFARFLVQKVHEKVPGERIVSGRRVRTLTYDYLLFPRQAGRFTIAAPRVSARLLQFVRVRRMAAGMESFGAGKNLVRSRHAMGGIQIIHVRALPVQAENLPVGLLDLHSGISEPKAVAGEPVTWTITLHGKGLQAASLPDMSRLMHIPGTFKTYPETPAVTVKRTPAGMVVHALWRLVALPQHAGSIDIPAITVPYFNPVKGRIEKTAADALHLTVSPAGKMEKNDVLHVGAPLVHAGSVTLPGVPVWWRWLAVAFFLLWLVTLGGWLLRARAASLFLRRKKRRHVSTGWVASATGSIEQFERLKRMLDLPARLSPLGLLDMYPGLRENAAVGWLTALEQGRYMSGEIPRPMGREAIRRIAGIIRATRRPPAMHFNPSGFGRIDAIRQRPETASGPSAG